VALRALIGGSGKEKKKSIRHGVLVSFAPERLDKAPADCRGGEKEARLEAMIKPGTW